MTPLERYRMMHEQTDGFRRRNMIKHHMIVHLKEIQRAAYEDCLNLAADFTGQGAVVADMIRERIKKNCD